MRSTYENSSTNVYTLSTANLACAAAGENILLILCERIQNQRRIFEQLAAFHVYDERQSRNIVAAQM